MKSVYKTSKSIGLAVLLIGAVGWVIAVYSSPSGFQIDAVVIILAAILLYIFLDVMWGTYVSVENGSVVRTDNFFMKKQIPVSDIDAVRYQPTYGVGREASSLFLFTKEQNVASITMTNLWFGEKKLSNFAKEIQKINPGIKFDEEALALIKKY